MAKKEEIAADAGLLQAVADLELIEKHIDVRTAASLPAGAGARHARGYEPWGCGSAGGGGPLTDPHALAEHCWRAPPHPLLALRTQNVANQTIAEILEMDPAMRAEVEKELDEANWAP